MILIPIAGPGRFYPPDLDLLLEICVSLSISSPARLVSLRDVMRSRSYLVRYFTVSSLTRFELFRIMQTAYCDRGEARGRAENLFVQRSPLYGVANLKIPASCSDICIVLRRGCLRSRRA